MHDHGDDQHTAATSWTAPAAADDDGDPEDAVLLGVGVGVEDGPDALADVLGRGAGGTRASWTSWCIRA